MIDSGTHPPQQADAYAQAERRSATEIPLVIYQTGMILLVVLLLGLASSSPAGKIVELSLPFLYAVIMVWSVVHLGALFFFSHVRRDRRFAQARNRQWIAPGLPTWSRIRGIRHERGAALPG